MGSFLEYRPLVEETATRYGYDPALLAAQAAQESGWRATVRNTRSGATGLMQFLASTWAEWGQGRDITDPAAQLDAGVRYMRWLLGQVGGDVRLALAAYNHGIGNVRAKIKAAKAATWEAIWPLLPEETQKYVPQILARRERYAALMGAAKAAIPAAGLAVLLLVGGLVLGRLA